jgi:hypothetical protein
MRFAQLKSDGEYHATATDGRNITPSYAPQKQGQRTFILCPILFVLGFSFCFMADTCAGDGFLYKKAKKNKKFCIKVFHFPLVRGMI